MTDQSSLTPRLTYPGQARIRQLEEQVDSLEIRLGPQDFPDRMRRLQEAVEAGIALEDYFRAARVLILAIQEVIDGSDRPDALDPLFVERALEETRRWETWFPFLDPDLQALAWELLDLLHCNRLRVRGSDVAIEDAADLVRRSPLPAVRTASRLLRITLEAGMADPRQVSWLHLLEDHSGFVDHLAFATEVRATLGMQIARMREQATGTLRDDFLRMHALHERLGETLGEGIPERPRPPSARELASLRQEGAILTREVMEVRASTVNRDPFLDSWMELSLARIEAYTGEAASAARILDQLLAKRFCIWDVALWRARLALSRDYPEDAREALERMARELPLFRRPGDSFQAPVFRLWEQAGGRDQDLGLADPPPAWIEEAARHRERDIASLLLGSHQGPVLQAFWAERRARLDHLLADLLDASDLDAAFGESPWPREVRVDPGDAARCHLDRLPDLPKDLQGLLLRAVTEPVPAREMARTFLSSLQAREAAGETLESLLRTFPALRGSRSFALERIRHLDLSGRTGEALALLDLYERLPDVPDRVILDLWLASRRLVGQGPRRQETIRHGRRIWARLRGDAGKACGEVLRQEALAWLQDPQETGTWVEMVQTILDTLPPDDLLDQLAHWYLEKGSRSLPLSSRDGFRIAGLLAGQPRSATCRSIRDLLKREVVDRLDEGLAHHSWADRRDFLDRLLEWGRGDPEVEDRIALWYRTAMASIRADDPAFPEAGEMGVWLSGVLRGESAVAVRRTTGQHLLKALQAARNAEQQQEVLRRIETLDPQDPSLQTLRQAVPFRASLWRFLPWMILAGVLGIGALAWWMSRS